MLLGLEVWCMRGAVGAMEQPFLALGSYIDILIERLDLSQPLRPVSSDPKCSRQLSPQLYD